MKTIEAFARILTGDGADAVGVLVSLETYVLASRRWVRLASVKSVAKGTWQAKVTKLRTGAYYAPILRLKEPNGILAQSGYLTYNTSTQTLSVDFGTVERLEQTTFSLIASSKQFNRVKYTIAGQPKKANTSSIVASTVAAAATNNQLLDTYSAEVFKFKATEADLRLQLSSKDKLLVNKDVLITDKNKRIGELEKKLLERIASETKLKKQNETFTSEIIRKTSINDIASGVGAEIDAANKKLRSNKQPYRFGKIELNLRGTIGKDGKTITPVNFVDLENISTAATLPGMILELLPAKDNTEVITSVNVPDVTGLTETVVRRLLNEVGLRLEVVTKSIGSETKIPVGQSMQQSPKAGDDLPRSKTVLVVFAAP